ncbi:hypothetical protein [Streptomyces vinaceus]|uniref:hypothetical protein n=1 Tax=Streptomyces vinaceus TaxID=1960 RepID=UPI003808CFDD
METHAHSTEAGSSPAATRQRLLTIYLNDHLAGAGSGVSLIRRMARTQRGTPAGPALAELAGEIAEDRDSLREIMTALDVPARWPGVIMGRLAEKAARAKPNGRLAGRSPLSDVLELEAMRLGVEGKASLWRSLRTLAGNGGPLDQAAVGRLLDRAERQAAVLERLRVDAVGRTFAGGAGAPARAGRGRGRSLLARHPLSRRAGWAS